MRIAIFADIHGKILLPFKLADLYQNETGKSIDLILQCGDIGAFPNLNNLDKATIRHAKKDRDELGFHDDFRIENAKIRAFLERLDLDMICVRGNHEDHDFLNDLERQHIGESRFPIDIYKRVFVCKSAEIQKFTKNKESLSFVGIGRIGDRKGRSHQQFIQAYEQEKIQKLLQSKTDFDFLITHDKDDSSQRGYGSTEIRKVLDNVIFQYHFYGHTGEPFSTELDDNQITINCKIKELEFDNTGILPKGCMVIMEKKVDGNWEIEIVEQRLTNQLQKWNWKIPNFKTA
jgi:Icc-related predicted phosphoesterase